MERLFNEAAAILARQPKSTIVATPRGPVEAVVTGEGPAVLSLHGGMGGYDQGLLLARSLFGTADYKVISVSRPGYLGTPLAAGATPDAQADLFAGLLDALGVARAIVIAVSAGGAGALRFAARHPERCDRIVLVSACSGRLGMPLRYRWPFWLMMLASRWPALAARMQKQALRDPDRAARRSLPDAEQRARTLAHAEAGPLLMALQVATRDRLGERLPGTWNDISQFRRAATYATPGIVAPVLAVHGTTDAAVPFAHAEAVAATVPGAELFAIDGGGHVSLFSHLDAIRDQVRAFLARTTATPVEDRPASP